MRRWTGIIAGLLVLFALGWTGAILHYERVVRPRALHEAGAVSVLPLAPDLPLDSLLPPANRPGNAADFYVPALNAYNVRRLPYLRRRGLNPIAEEPPIAEMEMRNLLQGACVKECDFFAEGGGRPRYTFYSVPDGKPHPFEVATDPFVMRPYVGPLRLLAQAALNRGKAAEQQKRLPEAERIYEAVVRLGEHLRARPGSLMDMELGLEIERRGVHYLETFYHFARDVVKQGASSLQDGSLERLQEAMRRKFAQLDNLEAAKRILREDRERVWRIEAAVALTTALYYQRPGRMEEVSIRRALADAAQDSDSHVRAAVAHLQHMPPSEFRSIKY